MGFDDGDGDIGFGLIRLTGGDDDADDGAAVREEGVVDSGRLRLVGTNFGFSKCSTLQSARGSVAHVGWSTRNDDMKCARSSSSPYRVNRRSISDKSA
jgi:hypothetical protein